MTCCRVSCVLLFFLFLLLLPCAESFAKTNKFCIVHGVHSARTPYLPFTCIAFWDGACNVLEARQCLHWELHSGTVCRLWAAPAASIGWPGVCALFYTKYFMFYWQLKLRMWRLLLLLPLSLFVSLSHLMSVCALPEYCRCFKYLFHLENCFQVVCSAA